MEDLTYLFQVLNDAPDPLPFYRRQRIDKELADLDCGTPPRAALLGFRCRDQEVQELKDELKASRLRLEAIGCCDVCWTDSWEPSNEGDAGAIRLKDGSWAECAMCKSMKWAQDMKDENEQLRNALSYAHGYAPKGETWSKEKSIDLALKYRLKTGLGVLARRVYTIQLLRKSGGYQQMTRFAYEGDWEVRELATETFNWLYELAE